MSEVIHTYTQTKNGSQYTYTKRYTPTGNKRGRPKLTEQEKLERLMKKIQEVQNKIDSMKTPTVLIIN